MTPAEKQKRYAYQKSRRQRIATAARAAGIIGQPRVSKYASEAERKAARTSYAKDYRKRITAQAKAYREMTKD